jgi:hypothetical protein
METIIKILLSRFWPTGVLFFAGFVVIIYVAFGFLYLQQGAQQREFEKQIATLSPIVLRPLPSDENLRAEYNEVNQALAPMTDQATVGIIVDIAEKSGIDIDPASGKLVIRPATVSHAEIGGSKYRLVSLNNIRVQGDYDNVMAFISDLDSGETLGTMVLNRVSISEVVVRFIGGEGARRAEFRDVVSAVVDMMNDNGLSTIPEPICFADGVATNLMGDDPDTEETVEGFPDTTTTVADTGYTGNVTPRDGYVLYNHAKIDPDDSTQFNTINYINALTTTYYYTCEADGTVRQFDGADIDTATEYSTSEETKLETVVTVNVVIYTKAGAEPEK